MMTVKEARATMAQAFQADLDLRRAYVDNVACVILDEMREMRKVKRDAVAGKILEVIFGGDTEEEDPLAPEMGLLVKLGSIMVHAEVGLSSGGHAFDLAALKGLIEDPEVVEWKKEMNARALLPVKR